MKTLCLAGGCFWGLEAFLRQLPGVEDTLCGYANGVGEAPPTYEEVCAGLRQFAEAVKVSYDETALPIEKLLEHFFRVIDPTSYHRQGNDCGIQYRSGIYCCDDKTADIAKHYVSQLQQHFTAPVQTEVLPLGSFFPAEEYHQRYLEKNPGGYCHIDLRSALECVRFCHPVAGTLPRENRPGLYVDAQSGTPLFSWRDYEGRDGDHIVFCAPITSRSVTMAAGEPLPKLLCANSGAEIGCYGSDCMYYVNKRSLVFLPADSLRERGYKDYRV